MADGFIVITKMFTFLLYFKYYKLGKKHKCEGELRCADISNIICLNILYMLKKAFCIWVCNLLFHALQPCIQLLICVTYVFAPYSPYHRKILFPTSVSLIQNSSINHEFAWFKLSSSKSRQFLQHRRLAL